MEFAFIQITAERRKRDEDEDDRTHYDALLVSHSAAQFFNMGNEPLEIYTMLLLQ